MGLQFLFLLSALWWMRIRGLCKLPDRMDWLWRKLGFALVGKAVLSKTWIQLSADGWGCALFLLVLWPEATQSWSLYTSIVGLRKIRSVTVSIVSLLVCHEVMELDAMILVFWMLSFKPTFSLSSFTFIKRLFSSSSLSAIRTVSSAYLTLLMFLLAVLISACASSSLAFYMRYSA